MKSGSKTSGFYAKEKKPKKQQKGKAEFSALPDDLLIATERMLVFLF